MKLLKIYAIKGKMKDIEFNKKMIEFLESLTIEERKIVITDLILHLIPKMEIEFPLYDGKCIHIDLSTTT